MVVKSVKNGDIEILLTKTGSDYKVIRLVGGNESMMTGAVDEESAFDIFDYWYDMEFGSSDVP